MSRCSSTPALHAAVSASSAIGSHAPNTRSSRSASGTSSLMSGERLSVRLPSRIVAICVSEPIGFDNPRRTLSTPAMNVVATAPRPGVRIPSLPVAGRMVLRAPLPALLELFEEPCTNSVSFQQWTRDAASAAEPTWLLSLGKAERLRFGSRRGLMVNEGNALHDRDPCRHGQQDNDDGQHPPVERQPEEGLRNGQEHDAFGTLKNADLGVESERFRTGSGIRGEERTNDTRQADNDHHDAMMR